MSVACPLSDVDRQISQRFVIAGGPGAGKSTLLRALAAAGETCYEEVSRTVIRKQHLQGTDAVPWGDLASFAARCGEQMLEQLHNCSPSGRCFFDRGLPDLIGYLNQDGLGAPPAWRTASQLYAATIFFAPAWREIYVNDSERPQSFAEARALSDHIRLAYLECGFHLVELEKVSVQERLRQVLQFVDIYPRGAHLG